MHLRRSRWLCPVVSLGLAAGLLVVAGFSWWTALLAAVLLGCPLSALWVVVTGTRPLPADEPVPQTRGMTMDWMAPVYDAMCPMMGLGVPFRRRTLDVAGLRPGENVLDVGCGTGVLTRLAAQAVAPGGETVGIDPGPGMIRLARQNAAAAASRAQFRLAAVERLPFEDGRFDAVLSSLMLHHLPPVERREGLQEIYRVLKPGGRLVVVDVARPAQWWRWIMAWPWLLAPTGPANFRGAVPRDLEAAGFRPVELLGRWRGILGFWLAHKPG